MSSRFDDDATREADSRRPRAASTASTAPGMIRQVGRAAV